MRNKQHLTINRIDDTVLDAAGGDHASFDTYYIDSDHVVIDVITYSKILGHLVAQMLDALGSTTSHQWSSRKRSAVDMMNGESSTTVNNLLCVKGMFDTAHHHMFFTLSQTTHDDKPLLHYYGNYQVDVLRKKRIS